MAIAESTMTVARCTYNLATRPRIVNLSDATRGVLHTFQASLEIARPEPGSTLPMHVHPAPPDRLPVVLSVQMESPLELLLQLPPEFLVTGLPGLFYLAKRTMTFDLEVTERAERLKYQAADWERQRSEAEVEVMRNYAEVFGQEHPARPLTIELDEE
jgi:hypothetical protein